MQRQTSTQSASKIAKSRCRHFEIASAIIAACIQFNLTKLICTAYKSGAKQGEVGADSLRASRAGQRQAGRQANTGAAAAPRRPAPPTWNPGPAAAAAAAVVAALEIVKVGGEARCARGAMSNGNFVLSASCIQRAAPGFALLGSQLKSCPYLFVFAKGLSAKIYYSRGEGCSCSNLIRLLCEYIGFKQTLPL